MPGSTGSIGILTTAKPKHSRTLKKSASIVLASILNVARGYASGLHSLRPCRTAFLSILRKPAKPPLVSIPQPIRLLLPAGRRGGNLFAIRPCSSAEVPALVDQVADWF